jgi:hypothetical protein
MLAFQRVENGRLECRFSSGNKREGGAVMIVTGK